jgi:hypothetical protein
MKTILFFDLHLNERGCSVSTYDYAHYNEVILGNKSIIASYKTADLTTYNKAKNRFSEVYLVDKFNDLENIKCDYVYNQKAGHYDGDLVSTAKNLVHAVFPAYAPHGDVYAYISEWLAAGIKQGNIRCEFTPTPEPSTIKNELLYVPYMVDLPKINNDFKDFFNIKKEELVIGWYGGVNSFDAELNIARQVVIDVAKKRKDIKFIFVNQEAFYDAENMIFVGGITDLEQKTTFINTCDMMLHARGRGETFGLAIAEFSIRNKPIITYSNSREKNHIMTLGDKGFYYHDYTSLYNILINIQKLDIEGKEWNCYQDYTPEKVMEKFNNVFLI